MKKLTDHERMSSDKVVADELTKTLADYCVIFTLDEPCVRFGEITFESHTVIGVLHRVAEKFSTPIEIDELPSLNIKSLPKLSAEDKKQIRFNKFSVAAMKGILANDDLIYLIETDEKNDDEPRIEMCIANAANLYAELAIEHVDDFNGFGS